MDKPILSDKNVVPDDKLLASHLKDKMNLWLKLLHEISGKFSSTSGSWNYYNDGKSWLFKMVQKKKTLFWAGLHEDCFRVTFYFGDKAEPVLNDSDLPQSLKDDFKIAKRYGAIRAITMKIMNNEDLDIVFKLSEIKSKLK